MNKHTDVLLEAIHDIAEIIHMQLPLRYQDKWLESIIERGIWKPDLSADNISYDCNPSSYTYIHKCKGKDCPACGVYDDETGEL